MCAGAAGSSSAGDMSKWKSSNRTAEDARVDGSFSSTPDFDLEWKCKCWYWNWLDFQMLRRNDNSTKYLKVCVYDRVRGLQLFSFGVKEQREGEKESLFTNSEVKNIFLLSVFHRSGFRSSRGVFKKFFCVFPFVSCFRFFFNFCLFLFFHFFL